MITFTDVSEKLCVTITQIKMMVYSGYLPKPTGDECWEDDHIIPFLDNWADKLARSRPKVDNDLIISGGHTFPRYQR